MKTTVTGFRISKNGSIIKSIEKDAIKEDVWLGKMFKDNGVYYFFNRKQGSTYIYLP